MEGSFDCRDKRGYPRVSIDLPLVYQDMGDSCSRGAMVVNAGAGGFLIESTKDIPVDTKLKVTLLFSKGFELANFEAVTKIVRKDRYSKEDSEGSQVWEGYLYGLEFIQVLGKDRWKLNWILGGHSEFEEIFSSLICQL
jgi:hypothetical protein